MHARLLSLTFLALLAAASARVQSGETPYPSRPLRIIVPATPGGPPDITARLVADKMSATFGRPVVVENRPGGSFTIGVAAVAKASPDGYTLGLLPMPATVSHSLVRPLPYDTEKDLAAVSMIAWSYNILAVPITSPVKSVSDLVAAAKAKPGLIKFSSGGNGTPAHLASELLKREAKLEIVHIPYKGSAPAATALLGGDVDMMIGATGVLTAHVKAGRLRALATPAAQRIAAYPDVPTFRELGYSTVQLREWHGIVVPAGTPKTIVQRLHGEVANAVALPETRQRFEPIGLEPASMQPAEFAAHIRSEIQRWARLVREAGIKAD